MGDPLSVAASMAALLSLSGQLIKVVKPYVLAATEDVSQIAREVHVELQSIQTILQVLDGLINSMTGRRFENEAFVRVDHLAAVLTNGVMILSEFSNIVGATVKPSEYNARLRLQTRLEWVNEHELQWMRILNSTRPGYGEDHFGDPFPRIVSIQGGQALTKAVFRVVRPGH